MNEVTWRPAVKADRPILERFCCASQDGPDYARVVQRYFRTQALPHLGAIDSRQTDQRLLLVFDADELVAAGCHRQGMPETVRNFVFGAVELGRQGMALSNGQRASDVLWQVVASDMLSRPSGPPTVVFARVHPDNARSIALCQRIGLTPTEADRHGLIIYAGPVVLPDGGQLDGADGG